MLSGLPGRALAVEIEITQQLCTDLKTDINVDLRAGDTPQSKRTNKTKLSFGLITHQKLYISF